MNWSFGNLWPKTCELSRNRRSSGSCSASDRLRMIRDQQVARSCRARRDIVSGKAHIELFMGLRTGDLLSLSSRSVIDVTFIEAANSSSGRRASSCFMVRAATRGSRAWLCALLGPGDGSALSSDVIRTSPLRAAHIECQDCLVSACSSVTAMAGKALSIFLSAVTSFTFKRLASATNSQSYAEQSLDSTSLMTSRDGT